MTLLSHFYTLALKRSDLHPERIKAISKRLKKQRKNKYKVPKATLTNIDLLEVRRPSVGNPS